MGRENNKRKSRGRSSADQRFMRLALEEAEKAAKEDEVPVGAVLVKDNKVIASDHNRIKARKDPTAHAEILVLRKACSRLKNERLGATILYTTVEPCPMCAGAIVLARVHQVVFGAPDPKAGAGGSVMNILDHSKLNHCVRVCARVLSSEARHIIQRFFQEKRQLKRRKI